MNFQKDGSSFLEDVNQAVIMGESEADLKNTSFFAQDFKNEFFAADHLEMAD